MLLYWPSPGALGTDHYFYPGDEQDDSSDCIERFIKPYASVRQTDSCCNGSDNDS